MSGGWPSSALTAAASATEEGVDLDRLGADQALGLSKIVLHRPRWAGFQALTAGPQEVLAPAYDLPGGAARLTSRSSDTPCRRRRTSPSLRRTDQRASRLPTALWPDPLISVRPV